MQPPDSQPVDRYRPPNRTRNPRSSTSDASREMRNTTSASESNSSIGSSNQLKYKTKTEDEKRKLRAARFSKPQPQQYGLVSRGEDVRLRKSSKERESFFLSIVKDFNTYCESTPSASLSQQLKLNESPNPMDTILMSLRKLREALLGSIPTQFSVKVFLFSVRISTPIGHYQTYIPAINYLLLPESRQILDPRDIEELATLLVLHLSHFNNHHTRAVETYFKYLKDERTLNILRAWYTKNYTVWVKAYNGETDNARSRIMKFGVQKMLESMVSTIQKSYFNLNKQFLESMLPSDVRLEDLHQYGANWVVEDQNVVIKKRA